MRWIILIFNLFAAVVLVFATAMTAAAKQTHAYSTYRELVINRAVVENPIYLNGERYDVEARIVGIGNGNAYVLFSYLGAGFCMINGVVFFFSQRRKKPDTN